MKRVLLLVAALAVGAVLANTLLAENGYVAISFRGYLIEMSVPTLVLCVVLTLAGLEAVQRLARWPRATPTCRPCTTSPPRAPRTCRALSSAATLGSRSRARPPPTSRDPC